MSGIFDWWRSIFSGGWLAHDEDPREVAERDLDGDASVEDFEAWRLHCVGAWSGLGSYINDSAMRRDIKFAKSIGLGRVDVILNDFASKRSAQKFETYNEARILDYCKRLRDEGFHVHLMSWWMPHRDFIERGSEKLVELVQKSDASSVMLDVEEPWLHANGAMGFDAASDLTSKLLAPIQWGITGIGYASVSGLGPLARVCDYIVPQCYATSNNTLNPSTMCQVIVKRWRTKMQIPERVRLVMGLAGYRQAGRAGYTKDRLMTEAWNGAIVTKPADIVYWSMRHLRQTKSTAKLVQQFAQQAVFRVT